MIFPTRAAIVTFFVRDGVFRNVNDREFLPAIVYVQHGLFSDSVRAIAVCSHDLTVLSGELRGWFQSIITIGRFTCLYQCCYVWTIVRLRSDIFTNSL